MNTKQLSAEGIANRLHVLVIGKQGTGKTYSLRTWPRPCFVADFDDKIDSLRGEDLEYDVFIPGHPATVQLLNEMKIANPQSARSVLHAFGRWLGQKAGLIMKGGGIGTIVVDTLTNFSETLMLAIREENGSAPNNQVYLGNLTMRDHGAPELQEYGIFMQKMRQILLEWRKIPCCFILNAHDRMDKDDATGQWVMMVETQGTKVCNRIADSFGEIWITKVSRGARGATYSFTVFNPRGPAATRVSLPTEFPQDYGWIKCYIEKAATEQKEDKE